MARKYWRFQGHDLNGKPFQKYFDTEAEYLEAKLRHKMERKASQGGVVRPRIENTRESTSARFERWMQDREKGLGRTQIKKRKGPKSPDAVKEERRVWTKFFDRKIGYLAPARLREEDLRPIFDEIAEKSGKIQHNRALALVRVFLKDLLLEGEITVNPVDRISGFEERIKTFDLENVILDRSQVQLLLDGARTFDYMLHAAFMLMVYSGLRTQETLALQRRDVYFDKGVIFVRRRRLQRSNKIVEGRKGGPIAEGLLPAKLSAFLKAHFERMPFKSPEAWVISHTDGTGMGYHQLNSRMKAFRKATGATITFHGLRHTFASFLRMAGAETPVIQRALGHATPRMAERYGTISSDYYRQHADRLNFEPESRVTGSGSKKTSYKPVTKKRSEKA